MEKIEIVNRSGSPGLARTRITIYDIIPYMEHGYDHKSIALVLQLSSAEVLALQQYIEDHKEEVMEEERKIKERIARGNPPEIEAKRQESHKKLLALREELRLKRLQQGANGASDTGRH
jgi:uncharacterized protein (DUF433 family)